MKIFCHPVRPEDVEELIDLTVENDPNSCSMARLQLEGIAAIYNILCRQSFAYLADEVGMGKTYQALGVAAMVWNECPDARILFLSPRQNLQIKWHSDYVRFFSSNYRRNQRLGDDRAVSILLRQPIHRPEVFHNLRSWLPTIGMPELIAPFIRHSSFTRPVFLNRKDFLNKNALWAKVSNQLRCWGLFEFDRPDELTDNNASLELNLMFAKALNAKLNNLSEGRRPYFDLVIVDEAQFLRNPQNQTNQVFHSIFQHNVAKWLFMSATPAHSGPEDFHKILNHYPGVGEVLDSTLVEDLEYLQKKLQKFLVRRSREYTTSSDSARVGKEEYRNHDAEGWAIRDGDMQVLDTLSIAVVQKGLVSVLQRRNNRYHIGFLSSFESLQNSLTQIKSNVISDTDGHDETTSGDWHHDHHDRLTDRQAPDTNFINDLAERFEKKFQIALRHPKVDYVADRVAELAFGTGTQLGGHKFLVFTRRVSTVDALCKRLMTKYVKSIEDRVRRCWGERIDWSAEGIDTEDLEDSEDLETVEEEFLDDRLRDALSKKGWLFRYRQTFRAQGRNSHFFEDGWLQRLCEAGGVVPEEAAKRLPQELWARSWTHASSASSRGHNRARRMRYLAVNTIRNNPEVFGLTASSAKPWRRAYELALHEHIDNGAANDNDTAHEAPELFSQPTLWTEWDKRFSTGPLELPVRVANDASKKRSHDELINELCRRQVIRVLISQIFRLTDTIVDLYYADKRGKRDTSILPRQFLDWLVSDDWSAVQVRRDCERWIKHLRVIVDSCLDAAGQNWENLAGKETWSQLNDMTAVKGVVGGSGAHRTAIRQFRTPSLPRVIVCTDTLKEGVDLHLFCDRVIHYGVAWTSGDLEQRVGRVDRYFSQIERRLRTEGSPPDVRLDVKYPHIFASLESGQVERVIERQRKVERLLHSPVAVSRTEDREIVVGRSVSRNPDGKISAYGRTENHFPTKRHKLSILSKQRACSIERHYQRWYKKFLRSTSNIGWRAEETEISNIPVRLSRGLTECCLNWGYDTSLRRYIITLSFSSRYTAHSSLGGKYKRLIGREYREPQSFIRLLVPTPQEGTNEELISHVLDLLEGRYPLTSDRATEFWVPVLKKISISQLEWESKNKVNTLVSTQRNRKQKITIQVYQGGIHLTSLISPIQDLEPRNDWGEEPSSDDVREWAMLTSNGLTLGYVELDNTDNLIFGAHVLHGQLSEDAGEQLIGEVSSRADAWEASLTGVDRY